MLVFPPPLRCSVLHLSHFASTKMKTHLKATSLKGRSEPGDWQFCWQKCELKVMQPEAQRLLAPVVLDAEYPSPSKVPPCYHDFKEAFSKTRASSIPPHWPYNCTMELLPVTSPPKGRLYSLSQPETAAMIEYIQNSLKAELINLSSSPVGAGFFPIGIRHYVPGMPIEALILQVLPPSPSLTYETHTTWSRS